MFNFEKIKDGRSIFEKRNLLSPKKWAATLAATFALNTALWTGSVAFAENVQETLPKPNIMFVLVEDISPIFGCYGSTIAQTPNLDAFAADSVVMTNAYTTVGVCAPSRSSFITGMYTQTLGTQNMRTKVPAVLPEGVKALPELMREGGYYSFVSGKLDYQFCGLSHGSGPFTMWDYEEMSTEYLVDSWKKAGNKPFFGWVSIDTPTHESALSPLRDIGPTEVQPEDVSVPSYYPDTLTVRKTIAQQYNNAIKMDADFGTLMEMLEKSGHKDDTIVIVASDHGDGFPRAKREIYDSGTHVVMIVHYPEAYAPAGYEPGTKDDRLISAVDLAPTVLDMAGISIPDYIQGQIFYGDHSSTREYVYMTRDRMDEAQYCQRAVRSTKYKYIRNYDEDGMAQGLPGAQHIAFRDKQDMLKEMYAMYQNGELNEAQSIWFKPLPREELYDMANDPEEVHNLVDDPAYASILEQMRTELDAYVARTPDWSLEMSEDEMIATIQPDGVQPVTAVPACKIEYNAENDTFRITVTDTETESIGFRIEGIHDSDTWLLYTGSLRLRSDMTIQFKAVRYGYAESPVLTLNLAELKQNK